MITPQIAVRGTAIKTPIKPNKFPKKNSPKIIQTGWIPILEPINFGVKKFDSITCPNKKIEEIIDIQNPPSDFYVL